jgi:glutaminyl-peptide cyclotransferase
MSEQPSAVSRQPYAQASYPAGRPHSPLLSRLSPLAFLLLFSLAACQQPPRDLVPEILNAYPHDPAAFTQGLLWHEGRLFESTGQYGESTLREVVPETGEVVRSLPLDARYFAEGLARVGDDLIQLTWREGTAFRYALATFELKRTYTYDTEGWGLCYDGAHLYMSDGSARLYRRDPETFAVTRTVVVREEVGGQETPVTRLNELECVGPHVYANVWLTDDLVRIDKESGRVVARIDASGLLSAGERAALGPDAVLNGVAYNPERDTFYLTGKLWPHLFEVRFVSRR